MGMPENQNPTIKDIIPETEVDLALDDQAVTHFESEKVLAKDWLMDEEDLAWRDL